MKQKSSKRTVLAAALAVAGVFGLITSPAFADVHVSQNGATLTVTAPSTLAGKGLLLQTDAESAGTWTTAATITEAVPSAGTTYTVDLAALGITNGTSCRIASATIYNRLDMLQMTNNNSWIDTGIKDSEVYGVRFGFYPVSSGNGNNHWGYCIGSAETGFTVGENGTSINTCVSCYRGSKFQGTARPTVNTTEINEYAYTNTVFTLNGTVYKSGLASASPVGTTATNLYLGTAYVVRQTGFTGGTRYLRGWWSHVSFDGADGGKILDYTPVQRGDGTVGFWNSVGDGAFVTCSGTGSFVAGTATGESFSTDVESLLTFTANRQLAYSSNEGTVTITVPAGLVGESIIIAWDEADKGKHLADWANSATLTDSATAGTITTRLGKLGIRNGDCARIFAANVYKPLDMLQMGTIQCWIDSGIAGTDVYGLRFGFYGTASSVSFSNVIGSHDGAGFNVGASGASSDSWYWVYRGFKDTNCNPKRERPAVSTTSINEVAFTNRVFTIGDHSITNANGAVVTLPAGSVATNDTTIVIGAENSSTLRRPYNGWWSHVSFDDEDGNLILDYIPVQRVSDSKVGFYDRASLSFVTSSGTGSFTAGTVTNDTPVVAVNASSATWKVTDIQGLIIIFK